MVCQIKKTDVPEQFADDTAGTLRELAFRIAQVAHTCTHTHTHKHMHAHIGQGRVNWNDQVLRMYTHV